MNTKRIVLLSIAILAILPFGANADYTYHQINRPARVESNGDVTINVGGPYVTASIENDDSEHIASTAYVKGAYNSAIAAVNKMNDDKQVKLNVEGDTNSVISPEVLGTSLSQIIPAIPLERDLGFRDSNFDNMLVTATGVINGIAEAAGILRDEVNEKRVTIYTTWNDDSASATTQVELSTAQ